MEMNVYIEAKLILPQGYVCVCVCVNVRLVTQSCLSLFDPMDCRLPGSSVHGILKERILEWVAISYFRGSSLSKERICISYVSCIGRRILHHCVTWGR